MGDILHAANRNLESGFHSVPSRNESQLSFATVLAFSPDVDYWIHPETGEKIDKGPEDLHNEVILRHGVKTVKGWTNRNYKVGQTVQGDELQELICEASIDGVEEIGYFLNSVGSFVENENFETEWNSYIDETLHVLRPQRWSFEIRSNFSHYDAVLHDLLNALRTTCSVNFSFDPPKFNIVEDADPWNTYKLGKAHERAKWSLQYELPLMKKLRHDSRNRLTSPVATAKLIEKTTTRHLEIIETWLKDNGFIPPLSRKNKRFLNRDALAEKIYECEIVDIKHERIKELMALIYKKLVVCPPYPMDRGISG